MSVKNTAIINYGMGNIGSVANALDLLGSSYFISNKKEELSRADAYILPGVGAFPAAMENLRRLDLVDELSEQVLFRKKPFLGICLGMQLVAQDSVEQGFTKGLGWVSGHVVAFDKEKDIRIPHVGWNNIKIVDRYPLFQKIDPDAHFYFDHCFYLMASSDGVAAACKYGDSFVAAIHVDNILATQFHPEKSQRNGLKLLRNFLNFVDSH